MSTSAETTDKLAIEGGQKAFTGRTGKAQPKIGTEEFLQLARRFGYSDEAIDRMRAAVSDADLPEYGPNLARYATSHPAPAMGEAFEALGREIFQVKHALGTSSGTGALHAAMVAVGAAPGKEVIVPALGFMATASAVALAGATPVFCDVDESQQIDPSKIEALITDKTVAVAPTHHWGVVADMDPILAVARKHNIKVIEDCAQTPGGSYKGKPVGSIGDIGCFSISAYKIIGGGEGGMLTTNDDRLFDRAQQLAECGGLWRKNRFAPPQYEGELFFGTNYRMSDLEAAINTVQMKKLPGIVKRTHDNYVRICSQLMPVKEVRNQKLNDIDGLVGYQLRFFPESYELAEKMAAALREEGVGGRHRGEKGSPDWHIYCDMFPLAESTDANCDRGQCPVAEDLYNRLITMGIDQWWNEADCDAVARAINKVLAAYCTPDENAAPWLRA